MCGVFGANRLAGRPLVCTFAEVGKQGNGIVSHLRISDGKIERRHRTNTAKAHGLLPTCNSAPDASRHLDPPSHCPLHTTLYRSHQTHLPHVEQSFPCPSAVYACSRIEGTLPRSSFIMLGYLSQAICRLLVIIVSRPSLVPPCSPAGNMPPCPRCSPLRVLSPRRGGKECPCSVGDPCTPV